jgi:type IV secretory pathway VirB6-like protein
MRRYLQLSVMICSLLAVLVASSAPAWAAPPKCKNVQIDKPANPASDFEIGTCAAKYGGQYDDWEFTSKLVACFEGTVENAVLAMMQVISNEFGWVVTALSMLAIIFYGVRTATGERELLKRTATLTLKLAFIIGFVQMLPTIVDWVFGSFQWLLALVTNGSPWQKIDVFIGKLFGFGKEIMILNGIVGLVGAAMFSSNVGISMFFFGVVAILNVLNFLLALIYTYCLAFLTIGFLLTLMPVVLPMHLLFYTERYFKKWVDLIVSAILTPVMLFAFVWMFLNIFDVLIQNIFNVLGGNDFKPYWRMNTSLYSWLMPSDPSTNLMMQGISTDEDVPCVHRAIIPPVQTNMNPMVKNAFDAGVGRVATLNFGANDVNIVQNLSFSFITLWIFSSLMKSMVHIIPQVASSIATVTTNIGFGGGSQVVEKIQGSINKTQGQLQKNLSGAAGNVQNMGKYTQQIQNMLGNRKK